MRQIQSSGPGLNLISNPVLRSRAEPSPISAKNPDPGLRSNLDLRSRSEIARTEFGVQSQVQIWNISSHPESLIFLVLEQCFWSYDRIQTSGPGLNRTTILDLRSRSEFASNPVLRSRTEFDVESSPQIQGRAEPDFGGNPRSRTGVESGSADPGLESPGLDPTSNPDLAPGPGLD